MEGGIGEVDIPGAVDRDSFWLAQRGRESAGAARNIVGPGDGLDDVFGCGNRSGTQKKELNQSIRAHHRYS
jgi:hypothetical protein